MTPNIITISERVITIENARQHGAEATPAIRVYAGRRALDGARPCAAPAMYRSILVSGMRKS